MGLVNTVIEFSFNGMFCRCDTIPERDRQTNRPLSTAQSNWRYAQQRLNKTSDQAAALVPVQVVVVVL